MTKLCSVCLKIKLPGLCGTMLQIAVQHLSPFILKYSHLDSKSWHLVSHNTMYQPTVAHSLELCCNTHKSVHPEYKVKCYCAIKPIQSHVHADY